VKSQPEKVEKAKPKQDKSKWWESKPSEKASPEKPYLDLFNSIKGKKDLPEAEKTEILKPHA
jgi:hypothetical protein